MEAKQNQACENDDPKSANRLARAHPKAYTSPDQAHTDRKHPIGTKIFGRGFLRQNFLDEVMTTTHIPRLLPLSQECLAHARGGTQDKCDTTQIQLVLHTRTTSRQQAESIKVIRLHLNLAGLRAPEWQFISEVPKQDQPKQHGPSRTHKGSTCGKA